MTSPVVKSSKLQTMDFWQSLRLRERLPAFVHLRRDVELARAAQEDRGGDER